MICDPDVVQNILRCFKVKEREGWGLCADEGYGGNSQYLAICHFKVLKNGCRKLEVLGRVKKMALPGTRGGRPVVRFLDWKGVESSKESV